MEMRRASAIGIAALAFLLAALPTGCADPEEPIPEVQPGQTVSADSPWVDSDLEGALLADTPVELRDDFASAVNRDWAAVTEPDERTGSTQPFSAAEAFVQERLVEIAAGIRDSEAENQNPGGVPEDELAHDEELLAEFTALASDWSARNAAGLEPLRPYVDAITGIADLEEMTAYLLNERGENLFARTLSPLRVAATLADHTTNVVQVYPAEDLLLTDLQQYTELDAAGRSIKLANEEAVHTVMARLGFDGAAADRALKMAYRFEIRLAEAAEAAEAASQTPLLDVEAAIAGSDRRFSVEELAAMEGDYPLTGLLARYGCDAAGEVSMGAPEYLRALGGIYTQEHLEEMKAYFLVHTLLDALPLLDREALEDYDAWYRAVYGAEAVTGDEQKDLLELYLNRYLAEPLSQVYIARYCNAEQKQDLTELIDKIVAYYRTMLEGEEWLGEETRALAVEKLDNLAVRVLYPDRFQSYMDLDLAGCADLLEAVSRISRFSETAAARRAGTPTDRSAWDLAAMPTTVANAYYMPSENSINILAGIVADSFLYDSAAPVETNLARLGFVVGHEITHAFDSSGYAYDKDGYYTDWWTPDDLLHFQSRAGAVSLYYSALIPYPGATGYDGSAVQGEAIADLGGMKCMLGLAQDIPDFDYALFFTSYAQLWREQSTLACEQAAAKNEHPLSYLRVNAVVQQFEEFYRTFGISEGDGMYLTPEKRLAVW